MDIYPARDEVTTAFRRECYTRRTAQVLEVKRQRFRDDLQQLVSHLGFSVPPRVLEVKRQRLRDDLQQLVRHLGLIVPQTDTEDDVPSEILQDALDLLGDEAFAKFVRQILQE
jgi:hypothetical protein